MAENVPFGTPFLTPKIPRKNVYVGPFFAFFPRTWGVLGGSPKVYVEKVYVLFPSPIGVALVNRLIF